MTSLLDRFHPRRWWLWQWRRDAIVANAIELLPMPYDLAEVIIEARTGQVIASPRRGHIVRLAEATTRSANRRVVKDTGRYVAGGEALALYGMGMAEKMLAVDEHAYAAMSNLSHAQIDNLSDLSAHLQQWDHSAWFGLSEGATSKLAGHIGEVHAAEHLGGIGAAVAWPSASNQAGWDLLVSGHEVNVKTIADASELHAHFANHPGIAALVPGDAANIPPDAFHLNPSSSINALDQYLETHQHGAVIVDHGLSHDDIFEQTADASDAALGGASATDVHLPWITVATSGWREIKLLSKAKTDMVAAAKNLSLDIAGRGGGAMAGAKVGALAGGIMGPAGAMFGGLVGGLAGALVGNQLAQSIKRRPLELAIAHYRQQKDALDKAARRLNLAAKGRYRNACKEEQQSFKLCAMDERSRLDREYLELVAWRRELEKIPKERADRLLALAKERIGKHRSQLVKELQAFGVLDRKIWPAERVLSIEFAIADLDNGLVAIASMEKAIASVAQSRLIALLAHYGIAEKLVRAIAKSAETERMAREQAFRNQIAGASARIAARRIRAFESLAKTLSRIVADIQAEIRPFVTRAADASKVVRVEMNKLGFE